MKRRLVVLRHAKSDWPVGTQDHERPLARRGIRDAETAGLWLAESLGTPDVVWCSSAVRTRETWAHVAPAFEEAPEPRIDDRIYEAELPALLAVLAETPRKCGLALLVGHNPGVQELVLALTDRGRSQARALAETKFPTCGLAVLDVDSDWAEIASGKATMTEFVVPRG
jgi:phosphohistidine phosphatase